MSAEFAEPISDSPAIAAGGVLSRCFVYSSFVNAWALQRGLRRMGIELKSITAMRALLRPCEERPRAGDILFFTEEESLGHFLGNNDFWFLPRRLAFPLDDKVAFAQVVAQTGEPTVDWSPIQGDREPREFPVFVKSRHSWRHGHKRLRGFLCRNLAAYRDAIARVEAAGWPTEEFFLQQWLPDGVRNSYSVAGFFDSRSPTSEALVVTHKLLARDAGISGSALAVETVDDPDDLMQRTRKLLTHLEFAGPFELEFLFDASDRRLKVLELNPRFWMQHGIFIEAGDNTVIRAYLGLGGGQCGPHTCRSGVVWLNGIDLTVGLARFDRQIFFFLLGVPRRLIRGARVILEPSFPMIVSYLARETVRRLVHGRRPAGSPAETRGQRFRTAPEDEP